MHCTPINIQQLKQNDELCSLHCPYNIYAGKDRHSKNTSFINREQKVDRRYSTEAR